MKTRTLSHRFLSIVTLLTLLLPLSPAPSLLARQSPPPSNTAGLVDAAADTCSPSAVVNLVASAGASPGTVELSWVAPGDDATAGTASAYIVRHNTTTITESNWGASSNVTGEPAPSPAGSVESMTVSGLAPGRTYYFAIKTRDEVPNTSSISNSPAAVARVGPSAIYLPLVASSASSVPTVIPDTTKVLPETTTQYLSEVSDDGAIFTFTQSTADLDALAPGDVIVSGPTANAPYGFLRRVTSVSSLGGQVVVTTEEATLEDAIESGEAHVSQLLTPNQIQSSTQLQGVKLESPSQLDDEFYWTLDTVVLYDHDKNPGTTNDQVVASGSIQLKPSLDFDLVISDWKLEELTFIAGAVETTKLEIGGKVELLGIEEEKVIARHTLTPITVPIPPSPFPVVIVPVLTVSVGMDGSVHVGVTTGVEQQATLKAGLRYAGGVWQPVSHFSNEFHYNPPTLSAGLNLKGYANAQLALLLYGVTGPYAELEAYLELVADIAQDPWWTLWAGMEMPLGVKVEVLGHTIVETETVPIAYRLALAHATSNNPPNLPFSPFPADGAIVQNLDVNPSWSGGDLDGDAVTYDVYFEAGDHTPDVLVSDDQASIAYDPGTLSARTDYYWRIVAQDEHGATTAGPVWEFTTATEETCPIDLTLQAPQVSHLTVTANGTATSDCSTITRINWQWGDGQGDDQWFPASHTYAVPGTYSITATAYNDLGDTEVANTTVHVSSPTITMDRVWTNDYWGNPKGTFRPGEAILLVLEATNHGLNTIDVIYDWDTYAPNGSKVSPLSWNDLAISMPPGEDIWHLTSGIPYGAPLGTYSYTGTVSYASGTSAGSTTFDVQGSYIDINPLEFVMCKDLDDNYRPVDVTDTFTTDDDYAYTWSIWEGTAGAPHTITREWYRPDGTLFGDSSYDFDTTWSVYQLWGWLSIGCVSDTPGQWSVKTYMDGSYVTTQYFTLVAGAQSRADDEPDPVSPILFGADGTRSSNPQPAFPPANAQNGDAFTHASDGSH